MSLAHAAFFAHRKGLSIEELRAQALEQAAAQAQAKSDAAAAAAAAKAAAAPGQEAVQERDERVAREIRARAQAEAKRKLERGEYSSGPGGKGNVRVSSGVRVQSVSWVEVVLRQSARVTAVEAASAGPLSRRCTSMFVGRSREKPDIASARPSGCISGPVQESYSSSNLQVSSLAMLVTLGDVCACREDKGDHAALA